MNSARCRGTVKFEVERHTLPFAARRQINRSLLGSTKNRKIPKVLVLQGLRDFFLFHKGLAAVKNLFYLKVFFIVSKKVFQKRKRNATKMQPKRACNQDATIAFCKKTQHKYNAQVTTMITRAKIATVAKAPGLGLTPAFFRFCMQ